MNYFTNTQKNSRGIATSNPPPIERDTPEEVQKRKTRYGISAIWPTATDSRSFYVWEIPANTVFAFKYFLGETGYAYNNEVLYKNYRTPFDQIEDLKRTTINFIELPELVEFDESAANRIVEVIHLPRRCTKYPTELETTCTSCWLAYLEHDAAERIENTLEGEEKTAAYALARRIISGLETALSDCKMLITKALTAIDDQRDPKTFLNENDLRNIYHTHGDKPKYKTAVNRESELADTMKDFFKNFGEMLKPQQPAISIDPQDTDALRAQLAEIQARLEEAERSERKTVSIEIVEKSDEELTRERQLEILAKARASKKANNKQESVE